MNNTQNQKIAQVTDKTLIVGVDIGRLLFTDIMTENRIRQKPYSVREKHVYGLECQHYETSKVQRHEIFSLSTWKGYGGNSDEARMFIQASSLLQAIVLSAKL